MKKYLGLFSILLIIIFATVRIPTSSFAQQSSNSEDIPSDLSLDLALAQQNPAPEQKAIVESQTQQAQVITSTGESSVLTPADIIPTEIKTQSITEAINPEQTTSEQVVLAPGANDQTEPSNQGTTSSNGNVVPGTSILEPDDNSAPAEPTPSVSPDNQSINNNNGQQQSGNIPLENGNNGSNSQDTNSAPSDNSNNNSGVPQPTDTQTQTSPSDNSNTNNGNDTNNNSSDNTIDNTIVEGISTGPTIPWWQKIFNKLFGKN